jgi:hypothetical protein
VGVGVAVGRAIKLRERQRGAQLEAARFLRLRDGDRDLKRLLGRRGIGRIALQQDLGADAVLSASYQGCSVRSACGTSQARQFGVSSALQR